MTLRPYNTEDGREVIYHPSPLLSHTGFIDGLPWRIGNTWVIRLKNMEAKYAQETGKDPSRNWVNAAALDRIEYATELREL